MKVKDVIKNLESYNPEAEIVLRPLYQNPLEPTYIMKKIRSYTQQDIVIIDGYEKEVIRGN